MPRAASFVSSVVEPTGASADPLLLKRRSRSCSSLSLATAFRRRRADAGKSDGKKIATFVVAPNGGIPTPAGDSGVGNGSGKGKGKQVAQFVVAPTGGIPTSGGGAGNGNGNGNGTGGGGKSGGKKFVPLLLKASNGIQVASADPSAPTGGKAFPLIADPAGIAAPAGDPGTEVGAAGSPAAGPAPEPQPVDAVDNGGGAAPEAPADATAAAKPAIQSPEDLYKVLVAHGYSVEILKHDSHGNLVFYVTGPGHPKEADLLVVDGEYGKVKERKHVVAYGYDRPATYAPRYAPAYVNDDNCDQQAGY